MNLAVQHLKDPKAYHKIKYRLFFISLTVNLLFLIFIFFSGISAGWRNFALNISDHFWAANGIYTAVFCFAMYLVNFGFYFFEGFIWEHRFQLSNQTFAKWLKDDLKRSLISFVITVIAVETVYLFLRSYPDTWWIWAGAFWLFLMLVLARITPTMIIPLFYKYSDIKNEELKKGILDLFEKCRLKVKDAYMVDFSAKTKKANAFVCGFGKSRRVVLSDNLVNQFSIPEIETVVAHEIGHYKNHDIVRLTAVNSAVTFLSFFLLDVFLKKMLIFGNIAYIYDIAFLPIIVVGLTVFSLATMPVLNGYSRFIERNADIFCLTVTRRPKDFISMIDKLGKMNLAEFESHPFIEKFFYNHPSIAKRIKLAEGFKG